MDNFENYYKTVDYLEGLFNLPIHGDYMIRGRNLGVYLKRMRYFLQLLGNPDKGMKFIHITGTSGKGTVTTMIHEILNVSGKNVGSFTSPFVTTSIEKIRVKDQYISPNRFADIVEYLKPFIDRANLEGPYGRPSYFEIFLAIALLYFKEMKCEWIVLEVVLGGRYDATNVIKKPIVTAITNIDYDHMAILGKTLQKIAYDKAGIIKRNSMFFTTEQRPNLLKIFKNICYEKDVKSYQIPHQNSYQKYNKALASAITKYLGIPELNITKGIEKARLQCRFEIIQDKPLVILDGAHNRAKVRSTIDNLKKLKYQKLHIIIGLADGKDSTTILRQIVPLADAVFVTRFQTKERKCTYPKLLLTKSKKYIKKNVKIEMFLDPAQALTKALKIAHKDDAVLVVGSFFLAGELRKKWFPEVQVLQQRRSF